MTISATLNLQAIISGSGFLASTPMGQSLPTNASAAEPSFFQLAAGNNQVLAPSVAGGATVTGVVVLSPSGSTNIKTFSGSSGGTGFTGTFMPFVGPIAAGGSFWIASAGIERVQLVWL